MRVRMAARALPMVRAGRTRLANEPAPETGSHPSLMAKNKIRMGPSAKLGNDRPNRLTTESRRSSQRLRRRAERTPAGVERRIAINSEASVRPTPREQAVVPAIAAAGGANSGGDGEKDRYQ